MKEHPIIFNSESVRAILEGRKTQTRRVITANNSTVCGFSPRCSISKDQSLWTGLVWDERVYKDRGSHILHPSLTEYLHVPWVHPDEGDDGRVFRVRCKYDIGDELWVKETWAAEAIYDHLKPSEIPDTAKIYYIDKHLHTAGGYSLFIEMGKVRSAMFMCKWMSRITLEITDVRAERLQEISEEDAKAEGAPELFTIPNPQILYPDVTGYHRGFLFMWNALNANRGLGWDVNPRCWTIEFKRITP